MRNADEIAKARALAAAQAIYDAMSPEELELYRLESIAFMARSNYEVALALYRQRHLN